MKATPAIKSLLSKLKRTQRYVSRKKKGSANRKKDIFKLQKLHARIADLRSEYRWFPSSEKCSACKKVNKDLQLSEGTWECPGCGVTHDRDINAAIDILEEAASSPWCQPVEREALALFIRTK